jgi:hypothetical protein
MAFSRLTLYTTSLQARPTRMARGPRPANSSKDLSRLLSLKLELTLDNFNYNTLSFVKHSSHRKWSRNATTTSKSVPWRRACSASVHAIQVGFFTQSPKLLCVRQRRARSLLALPTTPYQRPVQHQPDYHEEHTIEGGSLHSVALRQRNNSTWSASQAVGPQPRGVA